MLDLIPFFLKKNTSDPFDLGELLATFDRAHQDGLWDHLQMKCTASLLGLELEADKEDDINEVILHYIIFIITVLLNICLVRFYVINIIVKVVSYSDYTKGLLVILNYQLQCVCLVINL